MFVGLKLISMKKYLLGTIIAIVATVVIFMLSPDTNWVYGFYVLLPVVLLNLAVKYAENLKDAPASVRKAYMFTTIFPYLWVGLLSMAGVLPMHTIIIVLTIPVAIACFKTVLYSYAAEKSMADMKERTINLQLMFSLLLSVSVIAACFIF